MRIRFLGVFLLSLYDLLPAFVAGQALLVKLLKLRIIAFLGAYLGAQA